MSGIVWISLNEGVFVGASGHCRREVNEYTCNEPSLELTWLTPKTSSC